MTEVVERGGAGAIAGPQPEVSVVIATIGRPVQLAASLAAYEQLDPATPPFEVIVVLDGEEPPSRAVAQQPWRFACTVLAQPHRGISAAKNLGASRARADYLVFLNDDTRPAPDCLLAHLEAQHRHGPCIVLGHVDWDPEREITPYMRWLAPAGHQFNFERLDPDGPVGWDAVWGAHLAMPRAWTLDEPFDPDVSAAALEDTEWAYRQIVRRGRPARYVPAARAWHDHRYDGPADFRRRARLAGAVARTLARRYPALSWPLAVRPVAAAVAATLLAAWPGRWHRETAWDLDFRWNFVRGSLSPQGRRRLTRGHK